MAKGGGLPARWFEKVVTLARPQPHAAGRAPAPATSPAAVTGPASGRESGQRQALRVLQFNTLADGLAQNGGFIKVPKEALEWSHRAPLLLQEILAAQPDIVCLQEVNHFEDHFLPHMAEAGYHGVFFAKSPSPAEQYGFAPDGCCIFYQAQRFQMLSPAVTRSYTDNMGNPQNQGFMACCMKDTLTDTTLLVATTHLKAKASVENERIRVNQASQLVEGLYGLLGRGGDSSSARGEQMGSLGDAADGQPHVILTGDFNTTMDSEVCQILQSKGLASMWDGEAVPGIKQPGSGAGEGSEAAKPFTTWKFRESNGTEAEVKRVIDYIWFSSGLSMVSRWAQLSETDIGESGLPAMTYPSDHIAICCDLETPLSRQ